MGFQQKQGECVSLNVFDTKTANWFRDTLGKPTPVQEVSWPAIAAGGHGTFTRLMIFPAGFLWIP